jgi:hypothetical protein
MLALNHVRFLVFCSGGVLAALVACVLLDFAPSMYHWPLGGSDDEAGEEERSRDLEEQRVAILCRVDTRWRLGAEVAEGQLGLLEAAARFRDLDRRWPVLERDPRLAHLDQTDEMHYCRAVIAVVAIILDNRPETRAAVIERLEAELHGHLERGDLRFPESPLPGSAAAISTRNKGESQERPGEE